MAREEIYLTNQREDIPYARVRQAVDDILAKESERLAGRIEPLITSQRQFQKPAAWLERTCPYARVFITLRGITKLQGDGENVSFAGGQ